MRVDRAGYGVLTADGPRRVAPLPRPRDEGETTTVGDWLALDDDGAVARLPRTSLLARGSARAASDRQPLA